MCLSNDVFIGQGRAKEMFRRLQESGRLSHALLLAGPVGCGKGPLATLFAQKLLNTADADDAVQLDLIVPPKGDAIKIDFMRQLNQAVYKGSNLGGAKVALLKNIERLTDEAANAFLKILEEPPSGVYFIATTAYPELLLPTIRSRMQMIRLAPLRSDEVMALLRREGASLQKAEEIAALAHGNGKLALSYWQMPERIEVRQAFVSLIKGLQGVHTGQVIEAMVAEDERIKKEEKHQKNSTESAFLYRINAYKERLLWLRENWHTRLLESQNPQERRRLRKALAITQKAYGELAYRGDPRLTFTKHLLAALTVLEGEVTI